MQHCRQWSLHCMAADSVLEEEAADLEGDLYDNEGAQSLQEMLQKEQQATAEKAAAALAALQRGKRAPAAAAVQTKGGSTAEEEEGLKGPASQI